MKSKTTQQDQSIIQRLEELMDLAGPEFVHELIEVFLEIGRKDYELMKSAFKNSSLDKFVGAAHSLKATSLNIGAADLSDYCQAAESHKVFNSKTKVEEVLENIEAQLLNAENLLRGYIKETHSSAS